MKILRIKLRNLNSLRGEHVVDFTQEPLASASIFAITGPTGAGKSTLLDAMTLALYGQAARYNQERNPEDMMSRHTADCLAEVEFSVNQQSYRAEWQLRRAKGKMDGNVQPVVRFLYDANNVPLNRLATECTQQVESITGLDYQRFLRSVLLAQGEFSRFLKATDNERAALLESLTGTSIYSTLSKLAHEECGRRETELKIWRTELSHYIILSEEELAEKRQRTATLQTQWQSMQQTLSDLRARQTRGMELQKALAKTEEIRAKQAELAAIKESAQAEWERLSRHQLAQPFARSLYALDLAITAEIATVQAIQTKREQQLLARNHHATLLHHAQNHAGATMQQNLTERSEWQEKWQKNQTQAERVQEWLNKHAYLETWSDALARLTDQAHQLHHHHRQLRQWQEQRQELDTSRNTALNEQTQLAQLVATTKLAQEETDRVWQSKRQELSETLAQHQATDEVSLLADLMRRQQQLQQLAHYHQQSEQLLTSIATLEATIRDLDHHLADMVAKEQTAIQAVADAEKECLLRRDHLSAKEKIASFEEHRALLHDDEACPLCGSTDHPLRKHPSDIFSLSDLRKTIVEAEAVLKLREAELQNGRQLRASKEAQQQVTAQQCIEKKQQLHELGQQSQQLATALLLEKIDTALLTQAQDQCLKDLAHLQSLQKSLSNAEQERTHAAHRWQQATQKAADLQKRISDEQSRINKLHDSIEETQTLVTANTHALAQALEQYQFPLPDFSQATLALDSWQKAAITYQRGLQTQSDLRNEIEAGKREIDRCQKEYDQWQQRLLCWQQETNAFDHTTAHTQPQPQWRNYEEVEAACQHSRQLLAAEDAQEKILEQQRQQQSQEIENKRQELNGEIALSAFTDIATLRAAILSDADAKQIESAKHEWEKRHQEQQTLSAQLTTQIEELQKQQAPSREELVTVQSTLEQAEAEFITIQKEWNLLEDAIARDTTMRHEHSAKTQALAEREKELESWTLLRALIGSHDGSKFRKFAQGISLDILTHHANKHLSQLSERYRMQRQKNGELTLEIIDLYQANCTRPMASLSGGESFLASLALALGLSDLAGRNVQIDSLFIDEGFGALDADALDTAISTLETLHQRNKTIGIISHIDLLKERIATKIHVRRLSAGTSTLEVS